MVGVICFPKAAEEKEIEGKAASNSSKEEINFIAAKNDSLNTTCERHFNVVINIIRLGCIDFGLISFDTGGKHLLPGLGIIAHDPGSPIIYYLESV